MNADSFSISHPQTVEELFAKLKSVKKGIKESAANRFENEKKVQELMLQLEQMIPKEHSLEEQKALKKVSFALLKLKSKAPLSNTTAHQIERIVKKTDQLFYSYLKNVHSNLLEIQQKGHTKEQSDQIIHNLEQIVHLTDTTKYTSKEEKSILHDISQVLLDIKQSPSLTQEAFERIDAALQKIQTSWPESKQREGDLPFFEFAVYSDFECLDHNGAITNTLRSNLHFGKIPFFATSSLLSQMGFVHEDGKPKTSEDIEKNRISFFENMERELERWDVFKSGDIFLFLPKKEGRASLKAMGLYEEAFTQITDWHQIVAGEEHKPTVDDLIALFDPKSKCAKRVYWDGHGGGEEHMVGALSPKDYRKWIHFMNEQGGEFFGVTSCYSGGENSLRLYAEDARRIEEMAPKFFVTLNSIGGFVSAGRNFEVHQLFEHFRAFKAFTESQRYQKGEIKPVSDAQLKQAYARGFPTDRTFFDDRNLILRHSSEQIRTPSQSPVAQGFRTLGDTSDIAVLTNVKASQHVLKGQLPQKPFPFPLEASKIEDSKLEKLNVTPSKKAEKPLPFYLQDINLFSIYPLVVDFPISIQNFRNNKAPIFYSSIPGNAHHLFQEVRYTQGTLDEFLSSNKEFYIEDKSPGEDTKALFIQKFKAENDQIYSSVIMHFTPRAATCLYCIEEGDKKKYMLKERGTTKEISEEEFALKAYQIAQDTVPEEKSLKSTGEAKGERAFQDAFLGDGFWPNREAVPSILKTYISLSQQTVFSSEDIAKLKAFSPSAQNRLFDMAIKDGQTALASLLIQFPDVKPNMELLAAKGNLELMKAFLEGPKGEVFKTNQLEALQFQDGLAEACLHGKEDVALYLLENITNKITLRSVAENCLKTNQLELLKKLVDSGKLGLYLINSSIEWAIEHKDLSIAEKMVAWGGQVDSYNNSALFTAIDSRNEDAVRFLIEHKADINKPGRDEETPLRTAIEKGSSAIVRILLENPAANLEAKNSRGETPFLTACRLGRRAQAQMFLEKGVDLQVKDNEGKNALYYAYLVNDKEWIQTLKSRGCKLDVSPQLINKLFDYLISDRMSVYSPRINVNPDQALIQTLLDEVQGALEIKEDKFTQIYEKNPTLFQMVMQKEVQIPTELIRKIIENNDLASLQLSVDKGFDLKAAEKRGLSFLEFAFKKKNKEIFQYLLEHGASPSVEVYKSGREKIIYETLFEKCTHERNLTFAHECLKFMQPEDISESFIMNAIENGRLALLALLLDKGINLVELQVQVDTHEMNLFEFLVQRGTPGMLNNYLNKFKLDLNEKGYLSMALTASRNDMFRELIEHGADPRKTPKGSESPLILAMEYNEIDILAECLEKFPLTQEEKAFYLEEAKKIPNPKALALLEAL